GPQVTGNYIHNNNDGVLGLANETSSAFGSPAVAGTYANNLVVNNTGNGIKFYRYGDGLLSVTVVNNTIAGNGAAGLYHATFSSTSLVTRNNVVVNNATGIQTDTPFTPTPDYVGYNDVYNNSGGNWINYPASFGDLTTTN